MSEGDARHPPLTRNPQDLGIVRPIQARFANANVNCLPTLRSKQRGCPRREALIEQDPLHATRFKSTNSSSTEAAA